MNRTVNEFLMAKPTERPALISIQVRELLKLRRLPATLNMAQTAVMLRLLEHDILVLVHHGLRLPLGDPRPNALNTFMTSACKRSFKSARLALKARVFFVLAAVCCSIAPTCFCGRCFSLLMVLLSDQTSCSGQGIWSGRLYAGTIGPVELVTPNGNFRHLRCGFLAHRLPLSAVYRGGITIYTQDESPRREYWSVTR